jgi:hypothetical protein
MLAVAFPAGATLICNVVMTASPRPRSATRTCPGVVAVIAAAVSGASVVPAVPNAASPLPTKSPRPKPASAISAALLFCIVVSSQSESTGEETIAMHERE